MQGYLSMYLYDFNHGHAGEVDPRAVHGHRKVSEEFPEQDNFIIFYKITFENLKQFKCLNDADLHTLDIDDTLVIN